MKLVYWVKISVYNTSSAIVYFNLTILYMNLLLLSRDKKVPENFRNFDRMPIPYITTLMKLIQRYKNVIEYGFPQNIPNPHNVIITKHSIDLLGFTLVLEATVDVIKKSI